MRALKQHELLKTTGQALGLAATNSATDLLKPALRRAAFILSPASRADLIRFVAEPLTPLGVTRDQLEETLEELITYGDILEMRKLDSDDWDAPPYVLRPAPPSFVQRPDGTIIVLGVSGALPTPLTADLAQRVEDRGPVRVLTDKDARSLIAHLRLLGLTALSESAWLRMPTAETAHSHLHRWIQRLAAVEETPGGIRDLEILDFTRPIRFYTGRWTAPGASTTGTFIARRPQLFGARLWSIVEFNHGIARRLTDFYEDEEHQRPCDIAWRIQAAIDATNGRPQQVRVRPTSSGCTFDFFSPLPAFAERRLTLTGNKVCGVRCLFSFQVEERHVATERAALETHLWMQFVSDGALQ
jgi:hypothetical protein